MKGQDWRYSRIKGVTVFSLGVTMSDRIRDDHIRGSAWVGGFGDKRREARLRWFRHEKRR